MFRSSGPVVASAFSDRVEERRRLVAALESLTKGAPKWVALLGQRKVGKTSLLLEVARAVEPEIAVAMLDVFELTPPSPDLFRTLALRCVDALLADEARGSFERAAAGAQDFDGLLDRTPSVQALPAELKAELRALAKGPRPAQDARHLLELPERLAVALDRYLVVVIDEVQELAALATGRAAIDVFSVMRAVWQRHQRTSYVISGSAPSMLEELVTARHSPFFQHFEIMHLGPFDSADAVRLLVDGSPEDREIEAATAERIVQILGGHPFYLQLAGETLTSHPPPYDDAAVKDALQSLVFSRTGRLGLFFENEYRRIVGNATTLAATLGAVARSPATLTDVAGRASASTASAARYLDRLGDAVRRREDGRYEVADPVFAAWVRWRGPEGAVVPMTVLGDEAELAVAEHLAALGFDLVYQSRASRGAFDLLALRGPDQLALQVKRAALPLRFKKTEWRRMQGDAERWGWRWAIAHVDPETRAVRVLDPARARVQRAVRIDEAASVDNVLRWVDGR